MIEFLTILLIICAAASNAVMDLSSEGLFKNDFWNKEKSWKFKYKGHDPERGPAFPLSTTVLVGFTDGWHLSQLMFHSSWQILVAIHQDIAHPAIAFVVVKILFGIGFEVLYSGVRLRHLKENMSKTKVEETYSFAKKSEFPTKGKVGQAYYAEELNQYFLWMQDGYINIHGGEF